MENPLNLNSVIYYILRNLSMIAYIIEIQKWKICSYLNLFRKFDQSEPDH